jgi:hypothetical protein
MAGVGVEEDDGCHLDGHAVAKTRVMFVVSKSQGRVETTESMMCLVSSRKVYYFLFLPLIL